MTDQKRRAWVDWLRAECTRTPVLLIVDDAHWADQLSMELIGYALKQLADAPFLVLASARPEIHDQFPRLADDSNRQEIQLDTLRPADCDALVRDVLGEQVSDATRKRLVDRSAGNAFYLEELIRASAGGDTDALPESVIASVQLRVAALPDGARQVLRAASIFGRNFWSGGIVALLGLDTTPGEVSDWLDALEGAELIERADESALPDQNQYRFRHDITREAVYHMLTDADRITGHRLVTGSRTTARPSRSCWPSTSPVAAPRKKPWRCSSRQRGKRCRVAGTAPTASRGLPMTAWKRCARRRRIFAGRARQVWRRTPI